MDTSVRSGVMATGLEAIPSLQALFRPVQAWADWPDASAAEPVQRLRSLPASRSRKTNPHLARSWLWSDVLSLPRASMHVDPENCHNSRCAHTPHSGEDETTNRSSMPGIPHSRRRLVSKRD